MRRRIVLLLLLALPTPLLAQQSNALVLNPGDQIRLRAPFAHDSRVSGRVVTVGPVLLGFSLDSQPNVVLTRPYTTIDTLDVRHRSRRLSARNGAIWGLYLGTAIGAIVGPFLAADLSIETDRGIAIFGLSGAILGSATGAAAGAAIAPVRWYRYVFRE